MACHRLALALQDVSTSIQDLASDPSKAFVLHRSQCVSLAASYSLATSHILQQLHHTLSTCVDPRIHLELAPSLSELHHVILQGKTFMQHCLQQDGWVQKAVFLALSTEAQDVHLHDLVWCLCVTQQAMGQLVLQADEPDTNLYASLNAIWDATSYKDDLRVLLGALENEIACMPVQKKSQKGAEAHQHRLARFLFHRLLWENEHASASAAFDTLPPCLWADSDEFRIKESIGQGSYAVVHEVEWNGENYGQKEFFGVDADVFAREASIQARLKHPNLLQLICCTSKPSKDKCSLVMELMDTNLRKVIDKRQKEGINPPFSLLASVDLMLQIAKGMEHLHGLHIMHRDLKCLNILVKNLTTIDGSANDCRMHLKIADFGMSKAKNQSAKYTTLRVGTSFWRAPEVLNVSLETEFQEQSTAKYTKQADVYSFSMVCFEILGGEFTFDDGGKVAELRQRLINGERPKLPASCPPYLASYIERCWDGNPGNRPTFAQISRVLRHLKGVLLASADPLTPSALSVRSLTCIDDKLSRLIGANWPSTLSRRCVTTRSLIISFEMAWYTVMECKLMEEERISMAVKHSGMTKGQTPPISLGVVISKLIEGSWTRKGGFFSCGWQKSPENKAQMEGASDSESATTKCILSLTLWELVKLMGWTKLILGRACLVLSCFCCAWYNKRSRTQACGHRSDVQYQGKFRYSDLARATGHFQAGAYLGEGGSGKVFKGILSNGQAVAVKVMLKGSRFFKEDAFAAELKTLSLVRHRNIVPFLGYCFDKNNHLILVFKFMSRGSLADLLYNGQGPCMTVSWAERYEIACGVASALEYLHYGFHDAIVHRDVKPSNILLDNEYKAYLSDFGIATRMTDESRLSHVQGTLGYMDPEYVMTLRLGTETDVFAFGMVLLQLVSGRQAVEMDELGHDVSVLTYVETLYKEGRLLDAVDKRVRVDSTYDVQMSRVLRLGLACCEPRSRDRPNMKAVADALRNEIDLLIPSYLAQAGSSEARSNPTDS